ncbi:MAG: NAD-dependent epimerase/dehydratase family protein [Cereibacter sp.]
MEQNVLLTGISGFIAKRIAFDLLKAGMSVTGSLRSAGREDEVRAAMRAHGCDDAALARLRFVTLDLTRDAGWAEAMAGITAVIHTASPFPLAQPKDENELIRPALDGTLRVLRAAQAAGVTRVILTSSTEAVIHGVKSGPLSETDWTDLGAPTVTAYTKSKTLAERAAWDFVKAHPEMQLTVINPGMVLGTPMDGQTGSSVGAIGRLLGGRDPALPDVLLPVTDIADVSAAHLAALANPATIGQRYLVADGFLSLLEMARILKAAYPNRSITTRSAPRVLLRLLALFDGEIRMILPWLGMTLTLDNSKARRDLGLKITPARDSVLATAAALTPA